MTKYEEGDVEEEDNIQGERKMQVCSILCNIHCSEICGVGVLLA